MATIIFIETGLCFGYRIAVFAYSSLARTITHRFIEYCIHHHGMPHKTDYQKSYGRGSVAVYTLHGIHWFFPVFHQSEALGLEEQHNDLQKAQLYNR